jgi:hypothetical protein
MLKIENGVYIPEKEASTLYNFSRSWFAKCRLKKIGPPFIRIGAMTKSY